MTNTSEYSKSLTIFFVANNMKNPNDFSDIWEFYNYWKKRGMKTYADRRSYIIKLYKNIKPKKPVAKSGAYNFVHPARIKELKALKILILIYPNLSDFVKN